MQVPPWRKTQLFFSPATEAAAGLGDAQPGGEQGEGEEGEGEGEEVEEEEEEEQEEEEAIERERGEVLNFPTTWRNKCLYFHSSHVTAWDYLFLTKLTLEKKLVFSWVFLWFLVPVGLSGYEILFFCHLHYDKVGFLQRSIVDSAW